LTAEGYEGHKFDGLEFRVVADAEEAASTALVKGEIGSEIGLIDVAVMWSVSARSMWDIY
jgi:hypothetical protein